MSKLRKTALILEKPKLVKPKNDDYQIEKRRYVPNHNKAIHHIDFRKCTDSHIKLSLEAQALFGLRREESMKIVLGEAWKGSHLLIKASWAKGGISRVIEITSNKQRDWLKKTSQKIALEQSLIPQDRTYKQHLSHYQLQTKQMGLNKCHGLRYAYAQRRYHELTKALDPRKKGLLCPRAGGKSFKDLNNFEKSLDRRARTILSRNLGHSRIAITKIYLG